MLASDFGISQRAEVYAGNGARAQLSPAMEAFALLGQELQIAGEVLDALYKRLETVLTPPASSEGRPPPLPDPNCQLAQLGVELFDRAGHLRANLEALIARLAI